MSKDTNEIGFEDGLRELDAIAAWFEQPDVNLDQSLAKFERGLELSAALKNQLTVVENKIEKIKQRFDTPTDESLLD